MSGIPEEKIQNDYSETMAALRQAESVLPDFTSSYDGEIRQLYDRIVNRPAFQYDPANDPLYRNYRAQLTQEGSRAMLDTVGQAADLTGGYGSSYAQSLGQQQYGRYLERLGQVMPELYEAAWTRYREEGEDLDARLNTTRSLADSEVGRKRERFGMASSLEQQRYERREKQYQKLLSLITQSGYEPNEQELAAAGMSREQAEALHNAWLLKNPAARIGAGARSVRVRGGLMNRGYEETGWGGGTGSTGGSTQPGEKEQEKLDANKPGASNTDKHRRR